MKWFITIFLIYLFNYGSAQIDLSNIEIPDIDDISAVRERCDSKGGNGTYEKLKTAKDNLGTCLQGLVDFTVLKKEIEEAKKDGSLDEVFGKYCKKRSIVRNCVHNFTETLKLCLENSEKEALNTTLDVLGQLGEFACHGDGDRIALFVAEGGVECITGHTDAIKNCVNKTFKIETTPDTSSFPNLLIDKKRCDDLGKLQSCVVEELEKCSDSTPANIVDSLLRFIKRSACNNKKTKRSIRRLFKRNVSFFSTTGNSYELENKLLALVQKRCTQNAPETGYQAVTEAVNKMMECLKQSTDHYRLGGASIDQLKRKFKECSTDTIKATENCLSDDEKYFPQFYFDMTYSIMDFISANRAKFISGKFSRETMQCFNNFENVENKKLLLTCLNSTSIETDHIYTRGEICEEINSIKGCIAKVIDKTCIKDVEITKLNNDFFAAVTSPCNKKNNEIN